MPIQNKEYYEIGGEPYDRVTHILKIISSGLEEWYGEVGLKEAHRISREATGIGKRLHELIHEDTLRENILYEQKSVLKKKDSAAVRNCWQAYLDWKRERGLPKNAVVDYKTSKQVRKEYWLQLIAYEMAFKKRAGIFAEHLVSHETLRYAGTADLIVCGDESRELDLIIVRLDKDLGYYEQAQCPYEKEDLIRVWRAVLATYRYMNEGEENGKKD